MWQYIYKGNRPSVNVHRDGTDPISHEWHMKHFSNTLQRDGVVATLWRDNRVVTILSTNAQPDLQEVVQRRRHVGSRVDVPCTVSVGIYQKYMGGVDRKEQLRQYYTVRTKCRIFYKYICFTHQLICSLQQLLELVTTTATERVSTPACQVSGEEAP